MCVQVGRLRVRLLFQQQWLQAVLALSCVAAGQQQQQQQPAES
jgi:hypothetical protein